MNWRKLFNIPNKLQKDLISVDKNNILQKCDVIATKEYKEQKEAKDNNDNVCPKCHSKKDKIVNKIREVRGNGSVSGAFNFGFGNVSGSMSIGTYEISHCNQCGNEWKKYNIIYVTKTDIVKVALTYLAEILDDPKQKEHAWKLETIEIFENCYAETIYELYNEHEDYLSEIVGYKELKKYYKSVYDKESRNLLKI